jgi:hypothetical protein
MVGRRKSERGSVQSSQIDDKFKLLKSKTKMIKKNSRSTGQGKNFAYVIHNCPAKLLCSSNDTHGCCLPAAQTRKTGKVTALTERGEFKFRILRALGMKYLDQN